MAVSMPANALCCMSLPTSCGHACTCACGHLMHVLHEPSFCWRPFCLTSTINPNAIDKVVDDGVVQQDWLYMHTCIGCQNCAQVQQHVMTCAVLVLLAVHVPPLVRHAKLCCSCNVSCIALLCFDYTAISKASISPCSIEHLQTVQM